jgi:hypothetical protein
VTEQVDRIPDASRLVGSDPEASQSQSAIGGRVVLNQMIGRTDLRTRLPGSRPVYEVEFSDDEGCAHASLALPAGKLILLYHPPENR